MLADFGLNPASLAIDERERRKMILLPLLVGGALGCLYGWLLALAETKEYESTVVVEVKLKGVSEDAIERQRFANEFEILASAETLRQLARDFQLQEKWGRDRDSVIKVLLGAIKTEQLKGTSLVRLSVTNIDPEMALSLARGLPKAYMARKALLRQTAFEERMSELTPLLRNRQDEQGDKYDALMEVSQELGIPYLKDESLMKQAHLKLVKDYSESDLLDLGAKMERFDEAREEFEESAKRAEKLKAKIKEEVFRSLDVPEALVIHEQPRLPLTPKRIEGLGKRIAIAGSWGLFWGAVAGFLSVALSASKRRAAARGTPVESEEAETATDLW